MNIKILLADDHRLLRESLKRVLHDAVQFEVVAEANDGKEAIEFSKEIQLDVVLMDITMPNINGIEAARQILKVQPKIKVIILSMHANKQFVEDAFQSGVYGYLLKNCATSEVITAIQTVIQGKYYISPDIAGVVIEDLIQLKTNKQSLRSSELSAREQEILHLVCNGETTKQIANKLFISEKTVEVHRKHIMQKLNCNNLVELIKLSIQKGLISLEKL